MAAFPTGSFSSAPKAATPKVAPAPKATIVNTLGDTPTGYGSTGYDANPNAVPSAAATAASPQAAGQASYLTDPGYQAALNSQTQGNADIQAQLNAALSQAVIGYGNPSIASQLSQYGYTLSPEDAAAAAANTAAGTSTTAQLAQADKLAKSGIINTLTGHGLADSGDLGYKTGLENQQYANNTYNAQQQLLSQIASLEQNALSQKQALQAAVDQALQGAWNNVIQNPGAYTTAADVPQTPQAPVTNKPATATSAGTINNGYKPGKGGIRT